MRQLFRAALMLFPLVSLQAAESDLAVKVFVLAGQSNMEGQAVVDLTGRDYNDGKGTLLPKGKRAEKFKALAKLKLQSKVWQDCSNDWRAPFLPEATGAWADYLALDDLFAYNGSGVMPGRTWIIAPDVESLQSRWQKLIRAKADQKQDLFVPHLNRGKLGDRHVDREVKKMATGLS